MPISKTDKLLRESAEECIRLNHNFTTDELQAWIDNYARKFIDAYRRMTQPDIDAQSTISAINVLYDIMNEPHFLCYSLAAKDVAPGNATICVPAGLMAVLSVTLGDWVTATQLNHPARTELGGALTALTLSLEAWYTLTPAFDVLRSMQQENTSRD